MNIDRIAETGTLNELRAALKAAPKITAPELSLALSAAASLGRADQVRLLLNAGADPNTVDPHGGLPLISALDSHDPEIVEMIVQGGADVNRRDPIGTLPLFAAIDREVDGADQLSEPLQCGMSQKLLELGADLTLRDSEGQTAIELARKLRHAPFLKLLEELK